VTRIVGKPLLSYFYFYCVQNIHAILKQYWGFEKFRPLQEEIARSVLNGNDTLALLPTGGGKSICFQIPALAMDGMCLVISPLIALMKDQVYNLNQRGIKATAIYSGLTGKVVDTLLDNCALGKIKFLYISPERLANEDFRSRMERMKISLLAVDEAHCISQWGYDFRPPYLRIGEIREKLKNVPVIALTATATPEVVTDIQEKLLFKKKNVLQKSFVRKNLSYVTRYSINKEQTMLDILTKVNGSAVVYVKNRKRAKEYADFLKKHKVKADFYHAGLEPNERSRKQDDWIKNKTRVICCTNAFGMGIDKPDVRLVIHMDIAESIEAYFQEAGRAGRDEKKAYAVQLYERSDVIELEKKIANGFPDIDFISTVYDTLCRHLQIALYDGANQSFDFDLSVFADLMKQSPALVLSALKILEQQLFLYITESVYQLSQLKCICSKDTLTHFQEKNRNFEPIIKFILRTSEGVFEDFVPVDEQAFAPRLKISVEEVIELLSLLHKFKIFHYSPRKNKPQITLLQNRVKKEELRLDRTFISKRKKDFEKRLEAIRGYVTSNNICRTRYLVKYFGESIAEDCGICDVCAAGKKSGMNKDDFSKIVTTVQNELQQLALTGEQLMSKLNLKREYANKAIEYLIDKGDISITADGKMKWH